MPAAKPKIVSFAVFITSSSLYHFSVYTTGPKISFCAKYEVFGTSLKIVGPI